MDVHVGDVDIQALDLPGVRAVSLTLIVALWTYVVATLYRLCRDVRGVSEPPPPLLADQCGL